MILPGLCIFIVLLMVALIVCFVVTKKRVFSVALTVATAIIATLVLAFCVYGLIRFLIERPT